MSNTLINSNGYVQSQNIKVFPCAYRGYYEAPTKGSTDPVYKIINPEARTTSEYSFVNSYHKLSATKESYVISWTPPSTAGASNGVLKFVIGGYYFEIANCTLEDFITTENNNTVSKTFYINIKNNGDLPGQYLGSFESDVRWLDKDTGSENKLENFYFTGLKISTSNISSEASIVYSLTPFASQFQHWRSATSANIEEVLRDIDELTTAEQSLIHYTDEETNNYRAYSSLLAPTAASFKGAVVFYKQVFDINPAALPITNLLDSGSGKYSLRMLENTENGINNTTIASGDYSVALGKKTTSSGLVSTTLGNNTTASGEASLATGNITVASGINSVATGNETQAKGNNSFATGNKTKAQGNNSFTNGNETQALEENSLAFGEKVVANGKNAIATGCNTQTIVIDAETGAGAGAYGENSIIAGTDTTTTAAATNAVAIGSTTTAAGENSFVGGSNSEAKNENSFAFGNNVKTNANNQVVFGTYNVEDDTQAFIIANGTSTTKSNKFTVGYNGNIKALGTATIEGATTINSSLTTKGNITSDKTDPSGNAANNLILGRDTGNSSGTINVYGRTANTKVFEVTNAGDTTITGNINLTNTTGYSSSTTGTGENAVTTYSAALKVAGGVHIGEKLNVINNTTIGGTLSTTGEVTVSKDTDYTYANNNHSAALKVAGGVHIGKKLNVTTATTLGGTTTIAGVTSITNDTDYTAAEGETPLAAALKVTGGVHVGQKLNVANNTTIGGTLTAASNTILGGNSTTNVVNIKTNPTSEEVNVKITGSAKITNTTTIDGAVEITKDTESSSKTTGALIVAGGVGVGKNLNVDGDLKVAGDLVTTDTTKKIKFGNGISNSDKFVQINGTAEIANDLTLNEDLFVGGDLKLNGNSSTFELLDTNDNPTVQLTTTEAKLPGTDIAGNLSLTGALTASDTDSAHQIGSIKINDGAITGVSTLTASGTITANIFNATSDLRKKTNIKDYKCEKSILDLPIKSFEYINDESHTNYIGCIAQDLQEICPELVNKDADGFLSIQETKLIYLLLQEVRELKEKVTKLERR